MFTSKKCLFFVRQLHSSFNIDSPRERLENWGCGNEIWRLQGISRKQSRVQSKRGLISNVFQSSQMDSNGESSLKGY